jgi:hypothetical protein
MFLDHILVTHGAIGVHLGRVGGVLGAGMAIRTVEKSVDARRVGLRIRVVAVEAIRLHGPL